MSLLKTILSDHGVLGINARNLLYVKPFNPKKATAFADDKLKTKAFLTARGIPAAKIFARIETREQLRAFDFSQLPDECVLKPNYGFGGEGIIILKGRDKQGRFLRNGTRPMERSELIEHIGDILDGKFSLGGRLDTAFFEQVLVAHECFAPFRPVGLPDIRVVVFNLVPVMAMLRIPTAASDGKANLHLGGIGIGIDIAKGVTTHAAQYHTMIDVLPHGTSPKGIPIPNWDEILLICSRIQHVTNVGYLAVDITIDQQMGPAVLEVNARAGLNVQIANLAPLRERLERVQGLQISSPEKGVRVSQDLFGEKVKKIGKKKAEERTVLGLHETITIAGTGSTLEEPCIVAPDLDRTVFDPSLIDELIAIDAAEPEEGTAQSFRVKFTLKGKKLQTVVTAGSIVKGKTRAAIGRRDLKDFLIDPSIVQTAASAPAVRSDLRAVDKQLAQLDRDLLILKYLKPTNLSEERQRLMSDHAYNPLFQYAELEFDTDDVLRRLHEPVKDASPLGILLEKKRLELLARLNLLQARGTTDVFSEASDQLYGQPTSALIRAASAMIHNREACDMPTPQDNWLSSEEVQAAFMKVLTQYGLHDWKVSIRPKLVADVTVGGNNVYIREGAVFSPEHVEALIKHEIETHVLTSENGDHQPYELLRRGCAGYLDTQEGLATHNQNRVYGPTHDKYYNPPRNLLALDFGLTHSFAELRAYLHDTLGYDDVKSLNQAVAIKRGIADTSDQGGFTKSVAYFRGWRAVQKFVDDGGDLKRLYVGKIALADLDLVEKIPDIQPPLLLPEFLRQK